MRVLVTGSQFFTDLAVITAALALVWEPDAVLVTGACPKGAEAGAAHTWAQWGGRAERWEFDWELPAGTVVEARHRGMIEEGAEVCLNFGAQDGPTSLTRLAREAGIPTQEWAA
jgi:hypothetical protein